MGQRARAEEPEGGQVICALCANSEGELPGVSFVPVAGEDIDLPVGPSAGLCMNCVKVCRAIGEWMSLTPHASLVDLVSRLTSPTNHPNAAETVNRNALQRVGMITRGRTKAAEDDASAQFRAPYVDFPYRGK
jgi:hypothetical protein